MWLLALVRISRILTSLTDDGPHAMIPDTACLCYLLFAICINPGNCLESYCGSPGPLIGKSDSDWNGTGTAKSTSGWIVFEGAAPLSWAARSCTASARSTAEAEFMSISSLTVELVYLKRLIESTHKSQL